MVKKIIVAEGGQTKDGRKAKVKEHVRRIGRKAKKVVKAPKRRWEKERWGEAKPVLTTGVVTGSVASALIGLVALSRGHRTKRLVNNMDALVASVNVKGRPIYEKGRLAGYKLSFPSEAIAKRQMKEWQSINIPKNMILVRDGNKVIFANIRAGEGVPSTLAKLGISKFDIKMGSIWGAGYAALTAFDIRKRRVSAIRAVREKLGLKDVRVKPSLWRNTFEFKGVNRKGEVVTGSGRFIDDRAVKSSILVDK